MLQREEYANFVHFVLTGRYKEKQAIINAILNQMPEDEPFSVTRDYDSVLGIDQNVCIMSALTIYLVAKKEDTLSTNIHINYHFYTTKVSLVFSQYYT